MTFYDRTTKVYLWRAPILTKWKRVLRTEELLPFGLATSSTMIILFRSINFWWIASYTWEFHGISMSQRYSNVAYSIFTVRVFFTSASFARNEGVHPNSCHKGAVWRELFFVTIPSTHSTFLFIPCPYRWTLGYFSYLRMNRCARTAPKAMTRFRRSTEQVFD